MLVVTPLITIPNIYDKHLSEIKGNENEEPVTDNATAISMTDTEVANKTGGDEESTNVVDMETDNMSVDHATGSICSSLTENEITVQN